MNIVIYGMGYVGCVSAASLAKLGHNVIGIETSLNKVKMLRKGIAPCSERGLNDLISDGIKSGRLRIFDSLSRISEQVDVAFICVGTPPNSSGEVDTSFITSVLDSISTYISSERARDSKLHIIVRSTSPSSFHSTAISRLEGQLDPTLSCSFTYSINPEFLRESTAIDDFMSPPFILIGASQIGSEAELTELYSRIYKVDCCDLIVVNIEEASMIKYASNAFHGLKVVFANEIGLLCKKSGADPRVVMNTFSLDTSLNISTQYLKPGSPYGGSCLPKDIANLALEHPSSSNLFTSIISANERHLDHIIEMVHSFAAQEERLAIYGLTFKKNTDDLRSSPSIEIATRLAKAYSVVAIDEFSPDNIVGFNKKIYNELIQSGVTYQREINGSTLDDVAVMLIFHKPNPEIASLIMANESIKILDCTSVPSGLETHPGYHRIFCS